VTQHQPVHHPLEVHQDSVVNEQPQLSYQFFELGNVSSKPSISTSHYLIKLPYVSGEYKCWEGIWFILITINYRYFFKNQNQRTFYSSYFKNINEFVRFQERTSGSLVGYLNFFEKTWEIIVLYIRIEYFNFFDIHDCISKTRILKSWFSILIPIRPFMQFLIPTQIAGKEPRKYNS